MPGIATAEREGGSPAAEGSSALRVASRGIHTVRDCANLTLGIALDALTGHVGNKNGGLALRGMEGTRRLIETGIKIGDKTHVVDGSIAAKAPAGDEADLRREAELTAELEALRERRSA